MLKKTVAELETGRPGPLSSRELAEWQAFHRIRPLPDAHWDAAMIASNLINAWGGNTAVEDFLPSVVQQEAEPDPATDLLRFTVFASAHNERMKHER